MGSCDRDGEEALYLGMCAEPQADLPKLVFADWQEEHGEEVFAAAIRAECEFRQLWFEKPELYAVPSQPPEVWEVVDDDLHRFELLDRVIAACPKSHHKSLQQRVPKGSGVHKPSYYSVRIWESCADFEFRALPVELGFQTGKLLADRMPLASMAFPSVTCSSWAG